MEKRLLEEFMSKHPFIPIIVGTNINAYNMAISFHEEYQIKSVIVGREPLPFTSYSTITDIQELHPGLHDPKIFVQFCVKWQRSTVQLIKSLC